VSIYGWLVILGALLLCILMLTADFYLRYRRDELEEEKEVRANTEKPNVS